MFDTAWLRLEPLQVCLLCLAACQALQISSFTWCVIIVMVCNNSRMSTDCLFLVGWQCLFPVGWQCEWQSDLEDGVVLGYCADVVLHCLLLS